MPATSQAMYRAMQAAAHGRGRLGIPRQVGREFAAATPHPGSLPKRAGHRGMKLTRILRAHQRKHGKR